MSNTKTLTAEDLRQFTGSAKWYQHSLNQTVEYTEGVQYMAEHGGAYWLLEIIAMAQSHVPVVAAQEFQAWTLKVNPNATAILTCDDGNGCIVYEQSMSYAHFPLSEIKLFFRDNVIILPDEY